MHMENKESVLAGEWIRTFRHGKSLVICLAILGLIFFILAGLAIHLHQTTMANQQAHQEALLQATVLLVFLGMGMVVLAAWQFRLRQGVFAVHENGIFHAKGRTTTYTPFADIEDVYLFNSGKTAGLFTNLAYRRNGKDAFTLANTHLKDFDEFQELFFAIHLRERMPVVMHALELGDSITFNYISTGQVWRKRIFGNFLEIATEPIRLSKHTFEANGRPMPTSMLRRDTLSHWTENLVIKNMAGEVQFSTVAIGILSVDLFINLFDYVIEGPH